MPISTQQHNGCWQPTSSLTSLASDSLDLLGRTMMEHSWTNQHYVQEEAIFNFVSLGHRLICGRGGGTAQLIPCRHHMVLAGSCLSLQTMLRGHSHGCGPILADAWSLQTDSVSIWTVFYLLFTLVTTKSPCFKKKKKKAEVPYVFL